MPTMPTMPTYNEFKDAMDAVTRLYDLRETYARVKSEMDRLEGEMHSLQRKVWHILWRSQTVAAPESTTEGETKKEGGAS